MNHKSYSVEVLVNGKPVQEFVHTDKIYVEGKKGTKYSLRIKNSSWQKILAVITVDGLNVLTGKTGDWNDRGYIIDAFSSVVIDGWRTSDETVREFFFSAADKSYASKRKDVNTGVTGVIGVAIFEEKAPVQINYVRHTFHDPFFCNSGSVTLLNANNSTNTTSFNAKSLDVSQKYTAPERGSLGTGFGDEKESKVYKVTFTRASTMPETIFEMHYRTSEELKKIGVIRRQPQYVSFPENDEYCPVV